MLDNYLKETKIIDFSNIEIQELALKLSDDCNKDEEIAKNVFIYVRDEIRHVGDYKLNISTCKASDVLKQKVGWCYSKSHLVAALLRANGIPTAFCYQRLSCSEYEKGIYCLHGLNAVYLKDFGWYRFDVRGNKEGVDAQFNPPIEKLAFEIQENEYDIEEFYVEPLDCIVDFLETKYESYEKMSKKIPDIKELS
ncbi:transglutaminase family protein [Arcobacter sp. LA11]|uniref:transglutaminase-like domain-containing protein n=1 Tax=Arcobacter sp. LA11 TaxID=1898176 RepID=UPI00093507E8|nr:transglutaminase family protein [Arcobacter sp. LA11]